MDRSLIVLVCCGVLAGCSSGNPCSKACKKMERCLAGDSGASSGWTCPFSASCAPNEECRARCINDASCDALTGQDPVGQAAYQACLGVCAAQPPDQGPPADGGQPDVLQPADGWQPSDLPLMPLDHYVPPDAPPPPDQYVPPPDSGPTGCDLSVLGKACTQYGNECGSYHTCLLTSTTSGICTCACTPDNPQTPLVYEDSCPGAGNGSAGCGVVQLSTGLQYLCFKTCTPKLGTNLCGPASSCLPGSGAYVGLYGEAVCLVKGCTSNSDCPVTTGVPCVTTGAGCPSGQTCLPLAATGTAGICVVDGNCDTVSGICDVHTQGTASAQVGDTCEGDVQCAGNMTCLLQFDEQTYLSGPGGTCSTSSDCCTGGTCSNGTCQGGTCVTRQRNGYCVVPNCTYASSLPAFTCPSGSDCNSLFIGGLCEKTCDLQNASTCRGVTGDQLGDYECRAWDAVGFTSQPVCDFGTALTCADVQGIGLSCAQLGLTNNPTNMSCRDLQNTTLSSGSASGFCLDDTASGPLP